MKLGILANPEKYSIKEPLKRVLEWCNTRNHTVFVSSEFAGSVSGVSFNQSVSILKSEEDCVINSDFIITIGGDGTMLHAAQYVKHSSAPVLGINTGRLGFMANVQPGQAEQALDDLENGRFDIEQRAMLHASDKEGEELNALNEFLFTKKDTSSMVTLRAEYDGSLLNRFWADGLLVSTPTGSTAYNLSAGGPIVMPGTPVMIVTPINPHTLTTRPLVLPSDKKLVIEVKEQPDHILFSRDGRMFDNSISRVTICKSEYSVGLVMLQNQNYFETLRNKLMWGLDNRKSGQE
ncbi:MAG: NAD(+)/NADH kinase [Balneolaceae bacterium]